MFTSQATGCDARHSKEPRDRQAAWRSGSKASSPRRGLLIYVSDPIIVVEQMSENRSRSRPLSLARDAGVFLRKSQRFAGKRIFA